MPFKVWVEWSWPTAIVYLSTARCSPCTMKVATAAAAAVPIAIGTFMQVTEDRQTPGGWTDICEPLEVTHGTGPGLIWSQRRVKVCVQDHRPKYDPSDKSSSTQHMIQAFHIQWLSRYQQVAIYCNLCWWVPMSMKIVIENLNPAESDIR